MHESGAAAYQIDDAGCCDLVYLNTGVALTDVAVAVDTGRHGAFAARSGTGGP